MNKRTILAALLLSIGLLGLAYCMNTDVLAQSATPTASSEVIRGIVRDQTGPVKGAIVRALGTNRSAISADDGTFALDSLAPERVVNLSAWATGYFVAGKNDVSPGQTNVTLELAPRPTDDDPNYQWISAFKDPQQPLTCQHCMGCTSCNPAKSTLPFDEWQRDAHSQSASNPRFISMYNGTDLRSNKSPLTSYSFHLDYGKFPLRPDSTQPYYGPGFKLDFPDSAGNCAACHLPAASTNTPYQTDPNTATGVGREGVACDLCHKIWNVRLDPATHLPYPNMPGVLSFDFYRPVEGKQIFIGPYDDVPGRSVYSPLYNRSEYCAPCHFGVFWNTTIYNSFGEWLASPYSDPKNGKTCQDCHMPHTGATHFAQPPPDSPRIAYERDPQTIFSHVMPGASDVNLLQNSVTMTTTAQHVGDNVTVQVAIVNDKTGHHVPTDSPLRNVLLVITARDAQGRVLALRDGETLPAWAGDYAGQPGKGFAKVLEELWTEVSPSGAYWQATHVLSDNRLAALATDTSRYTFAAPATSESIIEVKLIFRRAFYELMKQKGWTDPDIMMASFKATVK